MDQPSKIRVTMIELLKEAEEAWTLLLAPDDHGVMYMTREHVRAVAFLMGIPGTSTTSAELAVAANADSGVFGNLQCDSKGQVGFVVAVLSVWR